ncbi:MAG TPA: 4-hydroxy-tetrahydrodipicolinate synthase [Epulopiscium sp.]|nr:4-hydroxy-tetrahydrodipicolinate synthase [Candidatus Epulonipiscium sp.]
MAIFEGSGVAIVTPFNLDGSVNYGKLEKLIDFQIENGTDSIVICGTTGEAPTLTRDEHLECISVAVKSANKRVPVIAGTGSNDTAYGVRLTKEAKRLGADATLQITPYYNKCTQNGLVAHFSEIAKATDLPMIIYSVASRTGLNVNADTVAKLAKIDTIVGIKEASGNITQVADIAAQCGGSFDIYSGNDDQIVPLLSLGGKGVISVVANILPKETHDIVRLFLDGDVTASRKLQLDYLGLIHLLFCEVNPIPIKAALNMMGWDVGGCRLPLTPLEDAHAVLLKTELKRLKLIP